MSGYLLDNAQELERLRVQAEVWEPAGRSLLERLGPGAGRRALDVGCGPLGWLRVLRDAGWSTVGADFDETLLASARSLELGVELLRDDIFDSQLEPASFDLVHARFQLSPLGRVEEQLAAYTRWLRPDGTLVLEDPDTASWHFSPEAPAAVLLIERIRERFLAAGGDLDMGLRLPALLPGAEIAAHVVALPPGHPYVQLPLQFARSLGLDDTEAAAAELADPARWGLTWTLVQAWRTY